MKKNRQNSKNIANNSRRNFIKNAGITSVDVSAQALDVAEKNASDHHTNIIFKKIDFLDEEQWQGLDKYDIIVSNPPYIPKIESEKMSKNVTAFEPGIALFVENSEPIIFYEKIAKFSQSHLKKQGKIYVEVHEEKANDVKKIFNKNGFKTEIKKDIYGKERMIKITK